MLSQGTNLLNSRDSEREKSGLHIDYAKSTCSGDRLT